MSDEVLIEEKGGTGLITLARPRALNALSLGMVRALTAALLSWRDDARIHAVAIRGMGKDAASPTGSAPFGAFCAGGDIRFFHQAALAGDPSLEDFFTEEYTLNHLIHHYPKPYVAILDGIVMGGGMGIAGHGGANSLRVVTPRTRMAMPETQIGLFPDVGGGHFLSRCPGRMGEYLALTGQVFGGADAVSLGLADGVVEAASLPAMWETLAQVNPASLHDKIAMFFIAGQQELAGAAAEIDQYFGLETVTAIVQALEGAPGDWARDTAAALRRRSPLMLHVVLEQVRRARHMSLGDDLRMERDLVRHSFHTAHLRRSATSSETVEGIRALAVDKDHTPHWNPARIEDITPDMVAPFFVSPWPSHAHPLASLR